MINSLSVGGYVHVTATANLASSPSNLLGVLCATTTSGTLQFYDDAATGTSTPITGVITPAAGSWTPLPFSTSKGVYCVVGGVIDATVALA